jgi:hypothetical protein
MNGILIANAGGAQRAADGYNIGRLAAAFLVMSGCKVQNVMVLSYSSGK